MKPSSRFAGGMAGRGEGQVLELGERIAARIDPRLADVWLDLIAARPAEQIDPELAWMLRMAYLQGYQDALSEPEQGALYASLGAPAPRRPGAKGGADRLRATTKSKRSRR